MTLYSLVGSSLPIQLYLAPLYFLWRTAGLVNNLFGLIIIDVALNSPLAIVLLRSYMMQLPRDFEDAARVDGANECQVFLKVVVPLSRPGFLTVGLVVSPNVWHEFLLATVFPTDQERFTVVTRYSNFTARFSQDWGLTSAAAVTLEWSTSSSSTGRPGSCTRQVARPRAAP